MLFAFYTYFDGAFRLGGWCIQSGAFSPEGWCIQTRQMVHSDYAGGAFGLVHSYNGAFSPTLHISYIGKIS